MTKVVLDTNYLVSAIGWDELPHRILLACLKGTLELCTSPAILEELVDVVICSTVAVSLRGVIGQSMRRVGTGGVVGETGFELVA